MSDLDGTAPDEHGAILTTIELHDSVIVGVEADGADLRVRLEWVYIYSGERLLRQEAGVLILSEVRDCRVDGAPSPFEAQLEDGEVLTWSLEGGKGRFAIDWCAYSPTRRVFTDWTFAYSSCRWIPEFEHTQGPHVGTE